MRASFHRDPAAKSRSTPRVWSALLLAICAIGSAPALAQPYDCDRNHIRAELASTGQVPDLTGCKPNEVRSILQSQDYGLTVENRVASDTIPAGRIVSQRVQSGNVYVDVSRRQGQQQQQPAGQYTEGAPLTVYLPQQPQQQPQQPQPQPQQPQEQPQQHQHHPGGGGKFLLKLFGTVLSNLPPPSQQQPAPQPNPVPSAPTHVIALPAPPPPIAQAPPPPPPQPPVNTVQAAVPPPPVHTVAPPAPNTDTQVAQVQPTPTHVTPQPPPAPVATPEPPTPPKETVPTAGTTTPPIPPPTPQFSIRASASAREGEELVLIIKREKDDVRDHRLLLAYSDTGLLVSPPRTFDFPPGPPDERSLRLRTKSGAKGDGDHDLMISLVSIDRTEVPQPESVLAVILDRPASPVPIWAIVLAAAAAAAAGSGLLLVPRATCSIEPGGVDLGAPPLKSHWPDVRADTVIGDAAFSIPSPLPIGSRRHAEPSPA